jgi:hypothetical protein
METQSFVNHRHNPKLSFVGFLFLLLAIVAFALRWFNVGGRYAMAVGLLGLIASIQVLLSISRIYITKLQDRIVVGDEGALCNTTPATCAYPRLNTANRSAALCLGRRTAGAAGAGRPREMDADQIASDPEVGAGLGSHLNAPGLRLHSRLGGPTCDGADAPSPVIATRCGAHHR